MEIISKSAEQTKSLGRELAKKLTGGEVIALYGELGSGKTTFTQGLAEGLGITKPTLSPTFTIRRSYAGRLKLEHFDFYRLESLTDLNPLDLDEVLGDPKTVTIVEWADKVGFEYPGMIKIWFEYLAENERKISSAALP